MAARASMSPAPTRRATRRSGWAGVAAHSVCLPAVPAGFFRARLGGRRRARIRLRCRWTGRWRWRRWRWRSWSCWRIRSRPRGRARRNWLCGNDGAADGRVPGRWITSRGEAQTSPHLPVRFLSAAAAPEHTELPVGSCSTGMLTFVKTHRMGCGEPIRRKVNLMRKLAISGFILLVMTLSTLTYPGNASAALPGSEVVTNGSGHGWSSTASRPQAVNPQAANLPGARSPRRCRCDLALDLRDLHFVHPIDDLQERARRGLHAPCGDEVRRIKGRVIDHVIDDVEARRLIEELG